jgi:hypothetical protein
MLRFTNVDDISVIHYDYFVSCENLAFALNIYSKKNGNFDVVIERVPMLPEVSP